MCHHCAAEFSDVTKRNLRNTCSDECDSASMVAARRANGTYKTTPEQNEKRAATMRDAYSSGRRLTSDEQRKKFSETMKRTWAEGRIDTSNHWSKTPEGKERISRATKGTVHTAESRKNMSLGAQRRLRSKREMLYTSARGGFRDDLGQYFRSSWEANFARVLNHRGKSWEYEPKTFQLEESLSYTPDFLSDGVFYEVKGQMDEKSKRQLDLMKRRYPDVVVEVIDSVKYADLRVLFKTQIPLWEGK
jgi:hypothetical protein